MPPQRYIRAQGAYLFSPATRSHREICPVEPFLRQQGIQSHDYYGSRHNNYALLGHFCGNGAYIFYLITHFPHECMPLLAIFTPKGHTFSIPSPIFSMIVCPFGPFLRQRGIETENRHGLGTKNMPHAPFFSAIGAYMF